MFISRCKGTGFRAKKDAQSLPMLILYNPEWSDNDFCLLVFLAKLGGSTSFATAEEAVEVTQVVEATTPADLTDTIDGVDQPARSMSQADINDIFREVLACAQLEKTTEG